MRTAIVCAAVVVSAAVVFAAPAHADPDSQFLARIAAAGITGDPAHLIDEAHQVCDAKGVTGIGIGMNPRQVAEFRTIAQLNAEGIQGAQQDQFVWAASDAYCPQLKGN